MIKGKVFARLLKSNLVQNFCFLRRCDVLSRHCDWAISFQIHAYVLGKIIFTFRENNLNKKLQLLIPIFLKRLNFTDLLPRIFVPCS